MAKPNLEHALIQNISPAKIAAYLSYKGWKKVKEAEGIASLWNHKNHNNEKISLLLPLDNEFADFEIKIEDLLSTLAKFENRSELEVLKALANLSVIAQRDYREIIDIKIESIAEEPDKSDKHEVPAKEAGAVLRALGSFFETMGDSLKNKTKSNRSKATIESELNLSLLDAFQGSFGVRIGLGIYENIRQLNILEKPAAQEVTEDFMELIDASSHNNPENLRRRIEKLGQDSLLKFKSLIKNLASLDSDLVLEWGSTDPDKGATVRFPFHKIMETLDIITKVELDNALQHNVIGKLIVAGVGKGKGKRKFIFIDEVNDKEYEGVISLDLISNLSNNIELDKLYEATIEEKSSINEVTGEQIKLQTLVSLKEFTGES